MPAIMRRDTLDRHRLCVMALIVDGISSRIFRAGSLAPRLIEVRYRQRRLVMMSGCRHGPEPMRTGSGQDLR